MIRPNVQCAILTGIVMVPGLLFAQPPGRGGPQGGRRGSPSTEMILQLFQQADTNNDSSVTRAELTAAIQNQSRRDRRGRIDPPPPANQLGGPGGPPRHEGSEGEHRRGHRGPPPRPGQVLPDPIAESLNLDERQTRQLADLQADVDKRLADILTDQQEDHLKNARPPHGPGHAEGEQGDRPAGRPQ